MEYKFLNDINSPADVKKLRPDQLKDLCAEIRDYMLECCAINPGHLASSLGAVELIVGLHYTYNTPEDKIVFDVGHQAYAHKIITGRKEDFKKNRCADGISGFPRMSESPYDSFGVGHSSTSISAALGYAVAAKIKGTGGKAIALIGDGALTGGLAFEGLNNAGNSNADILVILNDNNQSIDKNLGAVHEHLLRITTNPAYNRLKNRVWDTMGDKRMRYSIQRWMKSIKTWIIKKSGGDLFESLGFRYFGPIDGNDIGQVVETMQKISKIHGPRILHCITTKGKGYKPAEADPTTWHAPGRFNPSTGDRLVSSHPSDRYQDVFGQVLCQLCSMDDRVVGITPAMASGCGMNILAEKMPSRFFDVGIEEEHAVTFSAGLAAAGMRPFCNIYSSFAQRAYDQIIHDVALQNLPVVFCFDRAGLVGEDGATHHGAFDLAAFRPVPGLTIAAPSDEIQLKDMMFTALQQNSPFIIRYPRGMGEGCDWKSADFNVLPVGKSKVVREGGSIAILVLGPYVNKALAAVSRFEKSGGEKTTIIDVRYLKPLDEVLLSDILHTHQRILTIEDGVLKGGLYSAISELSHKLGTNSTIEGTGIPDIFVEQDTQNEQRKHFCLDEEGILEKLYLLQKKNEKVLQD